jgi:hypothetical protein
MFREMLKKKQLLSKEDTIQIMMEGSNGILSCFGDDEYPYGVPINYVYFDDKIYFHSAKVGHKVDSIHKHPKVSFSVVGEDTIVSAEYTSYFRSAIAFGKARIVEGEEHKKGFRALVEKYSGDQPEESKQYEMDNCDGAFIMAIDIDYMTGKAASELLESKSESL